MSHHAFIIGDVHDALATLPEEGVDLTVTSPPYNVGIDYGDKTDSLDWDAYFAFVGKVAKDLMRVTREGGRVCWNVANVNRTPYMPIASHSALAFIEAGWLMRGEVIWNKAASVGSSTAWGSWCSPSNPTLRDVHEYILVFCKGAYRLPSVGSDLTPDEFTAWTKSIWEFPTESAKRIGHPAPFPVELPTRCIKLFTSPGATILDPFGGSGTTVVAAKNLNRDSIYVDRNPEYRRMAVERGGFSQQTLHVHHDYTVQDLRPQQGATVETETAQPQEPVQGHRRPVSGL